MQKPSIPKGTRDFSPEEMAKRNYIFDTIKEVYRLYGFSQIETPAMENLSTLMGKYGEEGDKLLFKILNSGDFLKDVNEEDITEGNSVKTANKISEKGLRYDLTVPFARYVVMHRNEITFPFKRFQIQPVWRADRPQKGRYREFFQCDADIVGSDSLLNEIELILIIDEVFSRLGINVSIRINNRKILSGIAEIIGESEKITEFTVAIDKLEKIGLESVNKELASSGFTESSIIKLQPILKLSGSTEEKTAKLKEILTESEIGLKGVAEMDYLLDKSKSISLNNEVVLDLTLARGLNYYTGTIIEVKALDAEMGSITGGGRYDNLTGIFGLPGVSGVGISFGADRIYDVLTQLDLFPENLTHSTELMFVNFGEKEENYILPLITQLRGSGISSELYPEAAKMKKQLSYANNNRIPFVAMVGENEMKDNTITLKNMKSGEQKSVSLQEIKDIIKSH
ncbi:MAG: histidine--tRNA ligase [Fermentimonas sp.]|nr:histidine--tRNA ligase [Fermentimonas sp.]MDD4008701.1 histidine--tRNA ligase [Fermentimonas sp.]MDD4697616.1 histidine--tRNA ligase [Fermentimonas sp.]